VGLYRLVIDYGILSVLVGAAITPVEGCVFRSLTASGYFIGI
jgi:hypothetical protein